MPGWQHHLCCLKWGPLNILSAVQRQALILIILCQVRRKTRAIRQVFYLGIPLGTWTCSICRSFGAAQFSLLDSAIAQRRPILVFGWLRGCGPVPGRSEQQSTRKILSLTWPDMAVGQRWGPKRRPWYMEPRKACGFILTYFDPCRHWSSSTFVKRAGDRSETRTEGCAKERRTPCLSRACGRL